MRSFFAAVGMLMLIASVSLGQLLGNPGAGSDEEAGKRPVPGRPAAGVKRDADTVRPGGPNAGAPQGNALFAAMDADGDGVISKVELRKAIKALKTLDTDNDGSITLAEASVGAVPTAAVGLAANAPQVARLMAMDRNKDNTLTANEVPPAMQQMLGAADQNGDGVITRDEIAAAVANSRNQFGAGPWRGRPAAKAGGLNDAEQAMGQFLQHDKNNDGKLSEDELPQQMKRMMLADRNKDGQLDASEMQAALAQLGDRARPLRGGVDPAAPTDRGPADRKRPSNGN